MAPTLMPVAIIGMSCRLPGEVSTLDDFWTLMCRARSGWGEIPKDRFNKEAYWHPNPEKRGCFNSIGGYFLKEDIAKFDAPFFNITNNEASAMDPQQRQLLECTYEALEHAGIPKESIAGTNMGVFVGASPPDYGLGSLTDLDTVPMSDATGNHQGVQAGRISHYFDLRGPCFAIDTACSSSLHALHQAVQSIRSGETKQALVASSHLNIQPANVVSLSTNRLLSEKGATFAFDHRAKSGFARGEGTGCVILKPLDQALKDGDKVWSVVVNTGVNQDGKTVGMTTPSADAQEQLIREVYAKAGINPRDTGFVEAHGTGTKVGDPIEATVLHRVFNEDRTPRHPLYIGSVKSNIGHLEPASGLVAVIKASLMLQKGFILPNVNYRQANESIPFAEWNMKVPVSLRPWPKGKRFVSVNNFGFGGSNAHCVLEKAPPTLARGYNESNIGPRLVVLSGNDKDAVGRLKAIVGVWLEKHPDLFDRELLRDLAYTLAHRRSQLSWRTAVVGSSASDLTRALNSPAAQPIRALRAPKIAFVFTGQGAQWHAMGRELMVSHDVFASTVKEADEELKKLGATFSLIEELTKDKEHSQINKAHISQPACTVLQLAFTNLLRSWGVQPSSVVGHSSGEIAAAYAAGAINLKDAIAAAFHRGQAVLRLKAKHADLRGAMLAAGCSAQTAREMIQEIQTGHCGIACENSPSSVTISGDAQAIDELAARLEEKGTFNRKLMVDVAYHSVHMENVAEHYLSTIQDTKASSTGKVAFFSSLHGKRLVSGADLDAQYWVQNLTKPVLFSTALQALFLEDQPDIVVEVGPHSALEGPVKQILKSLGSDKASKAFYVPSLKRNEDATFSALTLAGKLFEKGVTLDMAAVNSEKDPKPKLVSDLMPYPWSGQKYWRESRVSRQHRLKPFARHDLLGALTNLSNDMEPTWRNMIRTDDIPWLRDHRMQDLTAFPFSGFISMAVEAAAQLASIRGVEFDEFGLREMQVMRPFLLTDGEEYEVILSIKRFSEGTRSYSDKWDEFRIHSYHESRGWVEHSRGLISVTKREQSNPISASLRDEVTDTVEKARQVCKSKIPTQLFYDELRKLGAGYGPVLQNILSLQACDDFRYGLGEVVVPDTGASMPEKYEAPSIFNAAFIDLLFQHIFVVLGAGRGEMPCLYMPSAIKEMRLNKLMNSTAGTPYQVVVNGHSDLRNPKTMEGCIHALESSDASIPAIVVKGFEVSPIKDDSSSDLETKPLCYKVEWKSLAEEAASQEAATVASGSTQQPAKKLTLNAPVVLITQRPESDPLISAVAASVEAQTGRAPEVSPLANLSAAGKVCLNLQDLDGSVLSDATQETFKQVQSMALESESFLWVVSGALKNAQSPHRSMAQGFVRTIRSEIGKPASLLDLDPESRLDVASQAELIVQAFEKLVGGENSATPEMEFAEVDGELAVPRIVEDANMNLFVQRETNVSAPYLQNFAQPERRLKLDIGRAGALDTLYFKDDEDEPLAADDVEIAVEATGMNFKDVVISMGQLASPYIGVECSGRIARVGSNVTALKVGDRVCAMPRGAYRTFARCHFTSAAKMPDNMTMEVGASIPVAYCTAWYGLMDIARLAEGERILIHAAAGGVGQAAIQIAKMVGAEIFATVGSVDKKQLIMDKYGIPEDRIYYSRSAGFARLIRRDTQGEGVDVVINSLAGELLRETWDCIAHFGRFIEIGKRDITSNTRLEMRRFENNALFSSVDLTVLAGERPKIMGRVMNAVMDAMGREALHTMYPITVMGITDVEKALRLLQGGKTTGKLIIAQGADEQVKATHRATKQKQFAKDASYLIFGGTGGLGRSMAKWMAQNDAGHVVLVSRSGSNAKTDDLAQELASLGCKIHVRACDITDPASVDSLVQDCLATLPPIRGVIHSTMVLRDMLFENTTFEDYDAVMRSKVSGGWNIHKSLLDTKLDFFIALSSVAGVVGNKGQAAYAAANTFLEGLVQHRRQQGLAGTAIALPAMDNVGYLAENEERRELVLKNLKGSTANEAELLALLTAAVSGTASASCDGLVLTGLHIDDSARPPYPAADARFADLLAAAGTSSQGSGQAASIHQVVSRAGCEDQASEAIVKGLIEKLSAILMVQPGDLDPASTLTAYGLDSLNAIELRNWISKELLAHLQVLELLTSATLTSLSLMILNKSRIELSYKVAAA
ncbi:Type I Polyketide synthase [Verticillium nonalfalfae]|uniref:Type I Polyketide synthase n=1 Tax=Verticillium nonalfalfae TaxID=1051616 RepID=A0A3M9Y894_9PEZI|nr:Type I Polyketide synthase [Verticillium nonalfalfae]RNJ56451.1 Type I Polyketide synthase [Verticillium nonalfalfae]